MLPLFYDFTILTGGSLVLLLHLRRFIRLLASCPWTDHLQMICRHCVMADEKPAKASAHEHRHLSHRRYKFDEHLKVARMKVRNKFEQETIRFMASKLVRSMDHWHPRNTSHLNIPIDALILFCR